MHTFTSRPDRAPVQPFTRPTHIRRYPAWPFPIASSGRLSNDVTANAKKVIATTARVFLGPPPYEAVHSTAVRAGF